MTRVPLVNPIVTGLINLRGQIVTAVCLRRRLALADRADGQRAMNIVVRAEGGAVALLVDEIGDVLEVDEQAFERPPETLQGVARDLIRGIYKLKDSLLLVLDADKAITIPAGPERSAAA
jgi:purine-binding chemotaxis protein CheW